MRRVRILILATLGLALGCYLVKYVGWRGVLAAVVTVGWGGFALLCACALGLFVLLGLAWRVLLPADAACGTWVLIRARMVRDSAAEVLPLSQLGGIAFGVRAAMLQGVSAPLASASMIVDVTTELVAQIAYAVLGVAFLVAYAPQTSRVASLTRIAVTGAVVASVAAVAFIVLQRYGERVTVRLPAWLLRSRGYTSAVTSTLSAIYQSPLRVAASGVLHLAGWIGNACMAWIAFRLIGAHVNLGAVIAIESLVYAARSAAVFIPNALGVQEGAYVLLAPLFGVGTELALAVSVLKRARDITLGVPVLLIWQAAEGRRAIAAAAAAGTGEAPT
jgi:glycosyltransferase 2 family protein